MFLCFLLSSFLFYSPTFLLQKQRQKNLFSLLLLFLKNAIFNFFDEIFIIKWISFSTSLGTFGTSQYFFVSMIFQESFFSVFFRGGGSPSMSCGVVQPTRPVNILHIRLVQKEVSLIWGSRWGLFVFPSPSRPPIKKRRT